MQKIRELYHYREMIASLVRKDLKVQSVQYIPDHKDL